MSSADLLVVVLGLLVACGVVVVFLILQQAGVCGRIPAGWPGPIQGISGDLALRLLLHQQPQQIATRLRVCSARRHASCQCAVCSLAALAFKWPVHLTA